MILVGERGEASSLFQLDRMQSSVLDDCLEKSESLQAIWTALECDSSLQGGLRLDRAPKVDDACEVEVEGLWIFKREFSLCSFDQTKRFSRGRNDEAPAGRFAVDSGKVDEEDDGDTESQLRLVFSGDVTSGGDEGVGKSEEPSEREGSESMARKG